MEPIHRLPGHLAVRVCHHQRLRLGGGMPLERETMPLERENSGGRGGMPLGGGESSVGGGECRERGRLLFRGRECRWRGRMPWESENAVGEGECRGRGRTPLEGENPVGEGELRWRGRIPLGERVTLEVGGGRGGGEGDRARCGAVRCGASKTHMKLTAPHKLTRGQQVH